MQPKTPAGFAHAVISTTFPKTWVAFNADTSGASETNCSTATTGKTRNCSKIVDTSNYQRILLRFYYVKMGVGSIKKDVDLLPMEN